MCRYAAYLGEALTLDALVYKPSHSLVHQSTEAMESLTRINADGFGVGWYAPEISPVPAVFKDISPLWNNRNLGSIAGKIRSGCIVAHVRSAKSFDPVTQENCHPFSRGRLLWMHNGDIPGRARLTRQVGRLADDTLLASIRGNTDSEMAFTLFLTFLESPLVEAPGVEALAAAMSRTLCQIAEWHRSPTETRPLEANFCVTNGSEVVASRFAVSDNPAPTLHWIESRGADGEPSVYVASEPLYPDDDWQTLDESSLLLVHADRRVETRPVELAAEVDSTVAGAAHSPGGMAL